MKNTFPKIMMNHGSWRMGVPPRWSFPCGRFSSMFHCWRLIPWSMFHAGPEPHQGGTAESGEGWWLEGGQPYHRVSLSHFQRWRLVRLVDGKVQNHHPICCFNKHVSTQFSFFLNQFVARLQSDVVNTPSHGFGILFFWRTFVPYHLWVIVQDLLLRLVEKAAPPWHSRLQPHQFPSVRRLRRLNVMHWAWLGQARYRCHCCACCAVTGILHVLGS